MTSRGSEKQCYIPISYSIHVGVAFLCTAPAASRMVRGVALSRKVFRVGIHLGKDHGGSHAAFMCQLLQHTVKPSPFSQC